MAVVEDLLLGLLLGASLILLSFSLISYRRSGLKGLLLLAVGLLIQIAFTAALLLASLTTDWFDGMDWWVVPSVGALALVIVLVVGTLGGRGLERSP
jgi:uncharacterized membrane protein YcjF (UPF0283 family)